MSVQPQPALQHDPGRFRALFTFEPVSDTGEARRQLNIAAATLLQELESEELATKPLKVLVAVAWDQLSEKQRAALGGEYAPYPRSQHSAVLVQVAAATEDERTYARRLVQRVFRDRGRKVLEYYGGRHALSREAFGFAEVALSGSDAAPTVPTSASAPGVSWLVFQRCVQLVNKFYDQSPESQEAVIGRPRTPMPDPDHPGVRYDAIPKSHIALEQEANGTPSRLLRRSISYETYDEEGLLFLASAKTAVELEGALRHFRDDPLHNFVELREGGIYVVPPTAGWLLPSGEVTALGADRPAMEEIFYPRFPLVLYEVTPLTLEFFKRVFHAHKDNFDDRGMLREDLKLMTKGLAKLLYGAAIPTDSPLFRFLSHAFEADSSAKVVGAFESAAEKTRTSRDAVAPFANDLEELSRERLAHAVERRAVFRKASGDGAARVEEDDRRFNERVEERRARVRAVLSQPALVKKAYGAPEWLEKSGTELLCEMIVSDAETMSGRTSAEKEDLESLVDLCERAAAEARAINAYVGYYMTFVC